MTAPPISHVRIVAQQDPVPTIVTRWGDAVHTARARVAALTDSLRELDKIAGTLAEKGVVVHVDLGPIGDAAAAARRDLEQEPARTFALPKPA
jgi:hypothetical protein